MLTGSYFELNTNFVASSDCIHSRIKGASGCFPDVHCLFNFSIFLSRLTCKARQIHCSFVSRKVNFGNRIVFLFGTDPYSLNRVSEPRQFLTSDKSLDRDTEMTSKVFKNPPRITLIKNNQPKTHPEIHETKTRKSGVDRNFRVYH